MNSNKFYKELKAKCSEKSIVKAAYKDNIVDYLWIDDKTHENIKPRIKFRSEPPTVVFDVKDHDSLTYSLGTKSSDVLIKGREQYSDDIMNSIIYYADIFLEVFYDIKNGN